MKRLLSIVILVTLPACALLDPHNGKVTAVARFEEVLISNHSSERVYYYVVGAEIAGLIDWIQHLDSTFSVAPGERRSVSYDEIDQKEGSEERAIVYWWHTERQGETATPGDLNHIVVDL